MNMCSIQPPEMREQFELLTDALRDAVEAAVLDWMQSPGVPVAGGVTDRTLIMHALMRVSVRVSGGRIGHAGGKAV